MSRTMLALSLVAAGFWCGVAFCQGATTLQDAKAAEEKNDYPAAQRLYEGHLKAHPNDPAALRKLAHAVFFQRDAKNAYEKLKQAYQIDPKKSELPELALAGLYAEYGDDRNAEIWLTRAIKKGADELPALLLFAQRAARSGNAETWLTKAIKKGADAPGARLLFARTFLKQGDLEKALANVEQILAIQPDSAEANVMADILRGQLALRAKKYKTAQRCFEDAEKLVPGDCAVRCGLALALCEQDDKAAQARALLFSRANFADYPENPEAAIAHARVLYRLGRIAEADKVTRQVDAKGAGVSQEMAYYVACIAADRGRKDEAAEMIRRTLGDPWQTGPDWRRGIEAEALALLARLYPDPKQEKLKPGDTVIVVVRAAFCHEGALFRQPIPGGTRLKVVGVEEGGDRVRVEDGKSGKVPVRRKDVAKVR